MECQTCLLEAMSLLNAVVKDLASGDILVSQLRLVLAHEKAFVENAAEALHLSSGQPSPKAMNEIFGKRKRELALLENQTSDVNHFVTICKEIGSGIENTAIHLKLN